ncbi:MAG: alpha-L-rhamnosidase N-terminal domain-containing protein, partial [Rhodothermales bacterium]
MKKQNEPANSRRDFLKKSTLGTSLLVVNPLPDDLTTAKLQPSSKLLAQGGTLPRPIAEWALDLAPAQWIWYPANRVLQNTVVLFRKRLYLNKKPVSAKGWILGDSRYRLFVNKQRQQWGPAPSDPRWSEADPLDLTDTLGEGVNIIGAEVLYYGQGDGTWPIGKAGFIFYLDITFENGESQRIVSDNSWQTQLARSWRPGQFKRWYLRAFQEEFDARLYPHGWLEAAYQPDDNWLTAKDLQGA